MGLHVAYLTHYAELYGANRSLLDLVLTARATRDIEPFVILAADGPLRMELDLQGIPNAVVPFATWMHKRVYMGGPHHRLMQQWRYFRQGRERTAKNRVVMDELVRLCREWKVRMVHANSAVIGLGGPLSRALGVPFVWHIRELHVDHYAFRVDGGDDRYRQELRRAEAIIAISGAVKREVERIQGPSERVHVVANGVVAEAALEGLRSASEVRWITTDPFRFVQLGLFHPAKGQLEALEAFARVHQEFPHTRLELAGGGRQDAVRHRIAELGLEGVVDLPGFVEDPFAVLEKAHCLLQCSRHEAMGRATVEAMASGLPVIGHASGATPELIEDGRTGQLYSDLEGLVACMRERVMDVDRSRTVGLAAQATIEGRFTLEAMTHGVVEVYWSLLREAGGT